MAIDRLKLIEDYEAELKVFKKWETDGIKTVSAAVAGEELARGRAEVPMQEYLTYWLVGLKALKNGADPKAFNY